jgi:hypothetical protein
MIGFRESVDNEQPLLGGEGGLGGLWSLECGAGSRPASGQRRETRYAGTRR